MTDRNGNFLLDALYPPSLVDPNTNYVHYTMRITIIDTVWIPSYLINIFTKKSST